MQQNPIVIDCDTGRDDALTLWVALSMGFPLAGVVASYGNTALSNVIDNTARVLSLAGHDEIPLLSGRDKPLHDHIGFKNIVLPRQAVSGNGLCNLELPTAKKNLPNPLSASDLAKQIKEISKNHDAPLDYVIIGPATNFALLCDTLGDEISAYISSVTMMGGKLSPLWEDMPGADFNIVSDPFALRQILEHGIAVRFVTMNTTWPIQLPLADVEALKPSDEIAAAAKELMILHCRNFAPEPIFRFHDPAVIVAAAKYGDHFKPVQLNVVCDENDENFGRLILSDTGFPAFIYEATDDVRRSILQDILKALGLTA